MKKILSLLLAITLVFALVACDNEKDTTSEPDTSTPTQTETESTENTETTDSDTADESSSETETPSSSTSTPTTSTETSTETSKPTTNDKDNTTSSKPSNTSSTPTETSKPTTSTPSTPSHTHSWGSWKTETKALIGKDGTEKRTCSSCKETEKRSTKANASHNSFFDFYLHEYFAWFMYSGNQTTFDISALFKCGDLIARDDYWDGNAEAIPVDVYYKSLKEYFVLTDDIISQMKSQRNADAYPVTMDGFTPQPFDTVVGYTHNGGKKYTVYWQSSYNADVKPIKVELEYNLLNDKPNRYISIEFVNAIPNDIIKQNTKPPYDFWTIIGW